MRGVAEEHGVAAAEGRQRAGQVVDVTLLMTWTLCPGGISGELPGTAYLMAKSNELDAEDRNELPDSAFAFPRLRKEPLNDARHVRNALARFDQVQDVTDKERDEAFQRIKRAADKFGVEVSEKSWHELGK